MKFLPAIGFVSGCAIAQVIDRALVQWNSNVFSTGDSRLIGAQAAVKWLAGLDDHRTRIFFIQFPAEEDSGLFFETGCQLFRERQGNDRAPIRRSNPGWHAAEVALNPAVFTVDRVAVINLADPRDKTQSQVIGSCHDLTSAIESDSHSIFTHTVLLCGSGCRTG